MKLQIPVDDVPIEGRVKNLEGLPVAGATIRVVGLFVPKHGDLDEFYQDVRAGKLNQQLLYDHLITFQGDELKEGRLDPLYPPVKTGKDGSFTFKGIGRERMALMRIEGEGIETEDVLVMTRRAEMVLATPPKEPEMQGFRALPILDGRHTVYGSKFEHTAAPSRPIVGVVRDLDTGKPVAGAVIAIESVDRTRVSLPVHIQVTADKEGRYKLTGAPVKVGVRLRIDGPADQPYLATSVEVPRAAGVGPVEVEAKLKRGVWATVRVFDKADKSAVTAEVHYFVLTENPNLKDLPTLRESRRQRVRIENAEYRVAVLPGPGLLAVRIPWDHNFALRGGRRGEATPAVPYPFRKMDYLGHVKIDPPADSKGVTCEIGLNSSDD